MVCNNNEMGLVTWLKEYISLEPAHKELVIAINAKGREFAEFALGLKAEHIELAAMCAELFVGASVPSLATLPPKPATAQPVASAEQIATVLGVEIPKIKKKTKREQYAQPWLQGTPGVPIIAEVEAAPVKRRKRKQRNFNRWTIDERKVLYRLLLPLQGDERKNMHKMIPYFQTKLPGRDAGSIRSEIECNFKYVAGWRQLPEGSPRHICDDVVEAHMIVVEEMKKAAKDAGKPTA